MAPEGRTVYALEQDGRNVYCSSAGCVRALLSKGWKLTQPEQMVALAQELAAGSFPSVHDPSEHFV